MTNLILTAISLGFIHTLAGPDHYVPFVALAKLKGWSALKTALITFVCGLGHVGTSVLIGFVGIGLGLSLGLLDGVESIRGDIANWLLLAFGLAYIVYGIRFAMKGKIHSHKHFHDGVEHSHAHFHDASACDDDHEKCGIKHIHSHSKFFSGQAGFWAIFIIFVFGPCEILIPLVMKPASEFNLWGVLTVTLAFSLSTICTMLAAVMLLCKGTSLLNFNQDFFARWGYAVSGACIAACAVLMFAGL